MGKSKKETQGQGQGQVEALPAYQPPQPLTAAELAVLYTPDEYRFTLSPELKKVAECQLKENVDREATVVLEQFRRWICKADYITDCRMGKEDGRD